MTKKNIVINIKPFVTNIRWFEGGFTWQFIAPMKEKGNLPRRKIINITFDRSWLSYLTNDLKEVLQSEIDELNRLKDLMGFKDDS